MKIRRINPMLKSLLAGICIYAAIGGIIIAVFTDRKLWNELGFIIGIILAMVMVIHMSISIDVAVHQDEDGALKHTKLMYIVRIILVVLVFTSMIYFKYANPIAALLGLFSLKFSAYLKLFTIKNKSKGR